MRIFDLSQVDYADALVLQERAVEAVARGEEELVYLLEHPHVFTLGRRGRNSNLLSHEGDNSGIPVFRINRGGDVTYHGPGQLIGYLHLDLSRRSRDVHRYLRDLEEVLIQTAGHFSVRAFRRPGLTGVWTARGKLASIGVGVRRWITMHGFALNVTSDLRYFRRINPCGIPDCPMTSLVLECRDGIDPVEVRHAVRSALLDVFDQQTLDANHANASNLL